MHLSVKLQFQFYCFSTYVNNHHCFLEKDFTKNYPICVLYKRFCNELVCCVGCQIIMVITLCGKLKGFFMRKGFIYQGKSVRNKSFGSSVILGKIFLVTNIFENLWILKAANGQTVELQILLSHNFN